MSTNITQPPTPSKSGARRTNALPSGYMLDEYRIEAILGAGGFGVTYKAEEEKPQTDYDKLLAELEDIKEKYRTEHASAQALRGRILAAIEQYDTAAE